MAAAGTGSPPEGDGVGDRVAHMLVGGRDAVHSGPCVKPEFTNLPYKWGDFQFRGRGQRGVSQEQHRPIHSIAGRFRRVFPNPLWTKRRQVPKSSPLRECVVESLVSPSQSAACLGHVGSGMREWRPRGDPGGIPC